MASVTSLDKDMRKLRLDRYTPQAANEVRAFIEDALGEPLPAGDLLNALKDGVALCKLINLALPNSPVRYKAKAVMPFVQMENISIFIDTCRQPPLNLHAHDIFLTVDLYEAKDPAQVLQCIGAFSRAANRLQPARFPSSIGAKKAGVMSPQSTGTGAGSYGSRDRGFSNASNSSFSQSSFSQSTRPQPPLPPARTGDANGARWSPTKSANGPTSPSQVSTSSWSKKSDEGSSAPAWNISQYGYMGGASQGNLGVSFGGRRQITTAAPTVPSLAEKEKRRREREAEEEQQRAQAEEDERRRRAELRAEEEQARIAEEARWAEETRKARELEQQKAEDEKRKWAEEEQRWRLEEERQQHEEAAAEARAQEERRKVRGAGDDRLQGQFLSQYQADHNPHHGGSESSRIQELERELERAREREREYERERQSRPAQPSRQTVEGHDMDMRRKQESSRTRARSRSRPRAHREQESDEAWREDERQYLRQQYASHHQGDEHPHSNEHSHSHSNHPPPSKSPRPLPEPTPQEPVRLKPNLTGPSSRPLPDPAQYAAANGPKPVVTSQASASPVIPPSKPQPSQPSQPSQPTQPSQPPSRTDRYLSSNPAPAPPAKHTTTYAPELGAFDSAAERDAEDRRRTATTPQTKASGGRASKSLLEREMELERQRQQEWEEGQKELKARGAAAAAATPTPAGHAPGVDGIGGGIGGKWDVNQWTGYTGGDSQNRGAQGIGSGRRQIVGPRPPPGR